MLSKLLKHEWRETWKVPSGALAAMIVMTLISVFSCLRMTPPADSDGVNMGAFMLLMLATVSISCVSLLITIYIAIRFYKNLYTDEGYLMHTLPVTPRQLITSKTIVAGFWYYLTSLSALSAILIVMRYCIPVMIKDTGEFSDVALAMSQMLGLKNAGTVLLFLLYILLSAVSSVLMVYGAVSLGQLFTRHKVLASVVCYAGIMFLMQMVTSLAITPYLTGLIISNNTTQYSIQLMMAPLMRSMYIITGISSAVFIVLFFILTEYVMKKQLNLD